MRRGSLLRGGLLALAGGAGVGFVLVGGGLVWLTTPAGTAWAKDRLLASVNAGVPGTVAIEALTMRLPGELSARGLALASPSGRPLVTVGSVSLRLRPRRLLDRELHLVSIRLDEVNVVLEPNGDGQLEVLHALGVSPPDPTLPPAPPVAWTGLEGLSVQVDELVLNSVSVAYSDAAASPETPTEVRVEEASVEATLSAVGNRVEVPRLWVQGVLAAPIQTPVSVNATGVFDAGLLELSQLVLSLEDTTVVVDGTVDALETAPVLALDAVVAQLDPADVNRLAGATLLSESVALEAALEGPLEALTATVDVSSPATGTLHLDTSVDLLADPVNWRVALESGRFDLQPLFPAVTEPVVLEGDWVVEGAGTAWPNGMEAELRVSSGATVLWGEPLQALALTGRLEEGRLRVTELRAGHALGSLAAEGEIDLEGSALNAFVTARMPRLQALEQLGLSGVQGEADFSGSVEVQWEASPLSMDLAGRLVTAGLASEAAEVEVSRAVVPLTLRLRDETLTARGSVSAKGLVHPSVSVETLAAEHWRAGRARSGALSLEASVEGSQVVAGEGAVVLDAVTAVISGGTDATGVPMADASAVLGALRVADTALSSEDGEVAVRLEADALAVSLGLSRGGTDLLRGAAEADLATGSWRIEDLLFAPTAPVRWQAEAPVRFRLVEGGIEDLDLRLQSYGGTIGLAGIWKGGTAPDTHLELAADGLALASLDSLFAALQPPGASPSPPVAGLSGTATVSATIHGEKAPETARVRLEAVLEDVVVPSAVEDAQAILAVDGPLAEPRFSLELGPSGAAPLARLEGTLPLELVEGVPAAVACGKPASLRFVVFPSELAALESVVGKLGLPEGRASLEVRSSDDICNPQIALTGAAEVVAGLRGERLRFDVEGGRAEDRVTVRAELEEDLARRLTLDVDLDTDLESALRALLAPAAAADPEAADPSRVSTWVRHLDVRLVPLELPLSTLGRLTDLPPTVSGVIGGGVHLRGAPTAPVMEGALLLVDGQVGTTSVDQAEVTLSPLGEEGQHRLSLVSSFGPGGEAGGLALEGTLPLALDLDSESLLALDQQGLELEVGGEGIPLRLLVGLAPGVVDAEGRLVLSGSAQGTLEQPRFDLRAEVQGGSVVSEGLGVHLRDLSLSARATPQLLDLERLQVSSTPLFGLRADSEARAGTLTLLGRVTLEDLQPSRVNLDLSADRFWLSATDDVRLAVDAGLALRGEAPALALGGSARLVTGEVALGRDFFSEGGSLELDPVLTIHRKRALDRAATPSNRSFWSDMKVDLDLDLDAGLRLRATVPTSLDYGDQFAELSTVGVSVLLGSPEPLRLEIRQGDTQLYGELEASRGDLNILGKGFSVASGSSLGFNGDLTDPSLAIGAAHSTAQYGAIDVDVGGSVSEVELAFSSDEYPDPTDVMSILVLGKPTRALSESEGQMGGALLGAALGSVANSLTRAVSGAFAGRLEIDGDSFRVGVPVSNSVFATMEVRSTDEKDENSLEMTLEWLLSSRLSAELVTGNQAATSADVYYRWRF